MKEKNFLIYKGKKIFFPDLKKVSEIGKIRGLMFRKKEKAKALLFEFKKPTKMRIHSFFVFFKFLGVWTDKDNKVIFKKIVTPWRVSIAPKKKFSKLFEIPINKKYRRKIMLLDESQKDL